MPKENIYLTDRSTDTKAQIGWQRGDHGAYVQLGVIPTDHQGAGADDRGLFTDLDRKAINRLIRLLSKARDDAYGKDE